MTGFGDRAAPRPWQRPALRGGGEHRQVGWLELFFDLIFVVIISILAGDLAHHLSAAGVLQFVLLFLGVFWAWNAVTFYTERFESDGLDSRLFTFLAIVAVTGLAVWGEDGLGHNYLGFALSYAVLRTLNIVLWLRAAHHNPPFRPTARAFTAGFAAAFALILVSFFVDESLRMLLWGVAVVLDIATPALSERTQRDLPQISRDKYPERFGLFTMIILGEVVASVIGGVVEVNAAGEFTVATALNAVLGLAIGFGMWWVYYDFIARRPFRPSFSVALAWVYLHFFVFIGVVAVGVAVEVAMTQTAEGVLSGPAQTVLLLGMSATLAAIGCVELTLAREADEPTHPVVSPALKFGLALLLVPVVFVPDLPVAAGLGIALAALVVPACYGALVWYRPVR
jgi:low temperature requirement protein LtrA